MRPDFINTTDLTLEFVRFRITQYIPDGVYPLRISVDEHRDYMMQTTIREISWMLLGKRIESVHYPTTWWDAFKARWYPRFLRKRYPPQFTEIPRYNICPHINHAFEKDSKPHFLFLQPEPEEALQGMEDIEL